MVSLVSLYSWILPFAVFISVYTYIVVCARANRFVRGCVTRNYISIADALIYFRSNTSGIMSRFLLDQGYIIHPTPLD